MTAKSFMRKIGLDCIILLIAFASIAILSFKVNYIQGLDGDVAPQTYALYSLVGKTLHNGELPLWNPYIWGGINNIGSPITEAFYPVNWILSYIFYDADTGIVSYAIIPWNLAIHIGIYFTGLYFLLKRIGAGRVWSAIISFLSVSCFSFAMYFTWLVYFGGLCWFPFLTLAALKLMEAEGKHALLHIIILGSLFAMEALLSVSVMLTITAVFIACLFAFKAVARKQGIGILIGKLAAAGILGMMLSMPVILSTLDFMMHGGRYVSDETGILYGFAKLPWEEFVKHKVSFEDGEALLSMLPERSWICLGGVLLVLCMIGIFSKPEKGDCLYGWSLAGLTFCLLYCFGYVVPDFVYYIPFLNALREPFMYGCILNFFASVFAGYGIKAVLSSDPGSLFSKIRHGKAAFGFLLLCIGYNLLPHKATSMQKTLLALLVLGSIMILASKKIKDKKIPLCLLAGAGIVSIYHFLTVMNTFGSMDSLWAIDRIRTVNLHNKEQFAEVINTAEDYFKIMYLGSNAYPSNQGEVLGIREDTGYFNPWPEIAAKCNNNLGMLQRSRLHNVKYWFINPEGNEELLEWWNAAYPEIPYTGRTLSLMPTWSSTEPSEIMLYQSNASYGEAWVVSDYDYYSGADEEGIFQWINNPETKLDQKAMINKDRISQSSIKQLEAIGSNPVSYTIHGIEHKNNSISYTVGSDRPAILVTAELYDAGWTVSVNGEKQEMLNVDYGNRAVVIPEGKSLVKFTYRPMSYVIGTAVQLAGILLVLIVGIYGHFFKKDRLMSKRGIF